MALEDIILALEKLMNGKLSDLNSDILQDKETREYLTTYFAEQQTRPELTSLIKSQSLMYDYLSLELKEREELEGFRIAYPEYLNGEGTKELLLDRKLKSENVSKIIKKQRYVNQLNRIFDFFLETREEGEVLNSNYLVTNKKLKKRFGTLGKNLYNNAIRNLKDEGGIEKIFELAEQERPEIRKYSDRIEVFKIDGVNQLNRIFDFFFETREEGEVLSTCYLQTNEKLKKRFGNLGKNLYENARVNLKDEGGFDFLVKLAAEINPDIKRYSDRIEVFKIDGVNQLKRIFDFFLETREEGDIFGPGYLQTNKKLKKRFGNLGMNLYFNARNNLKDEGGLDLLVKLAAEINPEIRKYTTFKEVLKIDGVNQLKRIFDFFFENREEGEVLTTRYLITNEKLKKRFGTLGKNLYNNAIRNLKDEGGINYLVQLAAKERPEILTHWKYQKNKQRATKKSLIKV